MYKAQKNAIGVAVVLTVNEAGAAVDISAATSMQIIFAKPDGKTLTKTATFDSGGTDGKLKYSTIAGDLTKIGLWKVRASFILGSFNGKTSWGEFEVVD